jgi:hypothetical protein
MVLQIQSKTDSSKAPDSPLCATHKHPMDTLKIIVHCTLPTWECPMDNEFNIHQTLILDKHSLDAFERIQVMLACWSVPWKLLSHPLDSCLKKVSIGWGQFQKTYSKVYVSNLHGNP